MKKMNVGKLFNVSVNYSQRDQRNIDEEASVIWRQIHRGAVSRQYSPRRENVYKQPIHPEEYQRLWTENEAKWKEFVCDHASRITYDSIPFPPCDQDVLEFSQLTGSRRPGSRADYKRACMRYHPDKFMQQFGSCLDKDDLAKIVARLTSITQSINSEWQKNKRRCASLAARN